MRRYAYLCLTCTIVFLLSYFLHWSVIEDKIEIATTAFSLAWVGAIVNDRLQRKRLGLTLSWGVIDKRLLFQGILQLSVLIVLGSFLYHKFSSKGWFGVILLSFLSALVAQATVESLKFFRR